MESLAATSGAAFATLTANSVAPESSAKLRQLSFASRCDGELLARLHTNLATGADSVTAAVSTAIGAVEAAAPTCVMNARRRMRVASKLLALKWEEFDDTGKILLSFLQQSAAGDSSVEFTEGTLRALDRFLEEMFGFPAVSVALTPAHSDAVQCVTESSRAVTGIDSARSIVSHAQWLVRGESNVVTIALVDSAGEAVQGVTPADVFVDVGEDCVGWSVSSVSVEGNTVMLALQLTTECYDTTALCVNISSSELIIPLKAARAIVEGTHVRTLAIRTKRENRGLAISPDGTRMLVSNWYANKIALYGLPDGAFLSEFGSEGDGPGQFHRPLKMCFSPLNRDHIFVTEWNNRRVQELTLTGAHVRTIGADVIPGVEGAAVGIAASAEMIAVGTWEQGKVFLFDIVSGGLLRSFGEEGDAQGLLNGCVGLRFTPDGGHILIAEWNNDRLSLFTVTGTFVRWLGVGQFRCPWDVDFATNGDILVADSNHFRICVFSPDGSTLLRAFGGIPGSAPGRFRYPAALAMHGGQLYVLDNDSARVQVFN